MVSQRQAAAMCSVSARTVSRAIEDGELIGEPGARPKSPTRIRVAELQRWAAARGLTLKTANGQVDAETGEVLEPTPIERATKARQRLAGVAPADERAEGIAQAVARRLEAEEHAERPIGEAREARRSNQARGEEWIERAVSAETRLAQLASFAFSDQLTPAQFREIARMVLG